jgi:hypothetical protein
MKVYNIVAPYYLTVAEWELSETGGLYRLIQIEGVGWASSTKSAHCQSLPRGGT